MEGNLHLRAHVLYGPTASIMSDFCIYNRRLKVFLSDFAHQAPVLAVAGEARAGGIPTGHRDEGMRR